MVRDAYFQGHIEESLPPSSKGVPSDQFGDGHQSNGEIQDGFGDKSTVEEVIALQGTHELIARLRHQHSAVVDKRGTRG